MFENVIRFVMNVDGKVAHWILENGTGIETAEKMAIQFLQSIGMVKAQNEAAVAAQKAAEAAKTQQSDPATPVQDHAVDVEQKPQ